LVIDCTTTGAPPPTGTPPTHIWRLEATQPCYLRAAGIPVASSGVWRHLRAIGLLPGIGVIAIPAIVLALTDFEIGWGLDGAAQAVPLLAGAALIGCGLLLMHRTIFLFAREGEGTLAPWDPTQRLVVRGPYRFVRNPMIVGVLLVVLGEAALFGAPALATWAALFFLMNAVWFPLVEEPALVRRFGRDYDEYRRHVPRWLPRRTPWSPAPPS
jgi:protein-S-isoprenylcysteine O-methyltransferase Ste14